MARPRGTATTARKRRLLAAARARTRAQHKIIEEVRAAREEGVSIRELAAILGHSTNTIQAWLSDERNKA